MPPDSAASCSDSASCGPQSQRPEPKTSPVRHSEWSLTSGTSARGAKDTAMCSCPSPSPENVIVSALCHSPLAKRTGTSTRARMRAAECDGSNSSGEFSPVDVMDKASSISLKRRAVGSGGATQCSECTPATAAHDPGRTDTETETL